MLTLFVLALLLAFASLGSWLSPHRWIPWTPDPGESRLMGLSILMGREYRPWN